MEQTEFKEGKSIVSTNIHPTDAIMLLARHLNTKECLAEVISQLSWFHYNIDKNPVDYKSRFALRLEAIRAEQEEMSEKMKERQKDLG